MHDLGFGGLSSSVGIPGMLGLNHTIDDDLVGWGNSVVCTSAIAPLLVMLSVTLERDGGRANVALLDGGRHDRLLMEFWSGVGVVMRMESSLQEAVCRQA